MWIITIAIVMSSFQEPGHVPVALGPQEQLFSRRALEDLRRYGPTMRYTAWPTGISVARVPGERIPAELKDEALTWIRRIVRPEYLPKDLAARISGFRGFGREDLIGVRYRLPEKCDVQILEGQSHLFVTIRRLEGLVATEEGIEDSIRKACKQFLLVDDEHLRQAEIRGIRRPESELLFDGSFRAKAQGKSPQFLAWWNDFAVLASDVVIAFDFRKSLGTGEVSLDAGAGPFQRFGRLDPPL